MSSRLQFDPFDHTPWIAKTPGAHLEFSQLWGSWLQSGETIVSAAWTITPDGVLKDAGHAITDDATSATIWLVGGQANTVYLVSCHVVTSAGREDDRAFEVRVSQG